MKLLLDSFWRAAAYCVHPRVIALSFLPVVLMVGLGLGFGYFFWQSAVDTVRAALDGSALVGIVLGWLQTVGAGNLKGVLSQLLVIFAVTPMLVVLSLLVVAATMTPAMVSLVAERRFVNLQRKQGGSLLGSVAWSLGSALLALVAMALSIPLWFVPPLVLVLPPLIWGWLTYRVLAYDALATHASADERREIFKRHRAVLLAIGVVSGFLGAAPNLLWVSGAVVAAAFVLLVPVAMWIYTLVFAFSSLWFAHYCLAALEQLRNEDLKQNTPHAGVESSFVATKIIAIESQNGPQTEPPTLAPPTPPSFPPLSPPV